MSKTPAPAQAVSVIIPAYNVGHCIGLCLESVLAHELQPLEILVVDNGSTDDTAKVVQGYGPRVTLIHQKNLGQGAARNAGLSRATGDFIAFLWCSSRLLPTASRSLPPGSGPWLRSLPMALPDFIVGAGSVVAKSFREGFVVIAGNPARVIGSTAEYSEKVRAKALNLKGLSYRAKEALLLGMDQERFLKR